MSVSTQSSAVPYNLAFVTTFIDDDGIGPFQFPVFRELFGVTSLFDSMSLIEAEPSEESAKSAILAYLGYIRRCVSQASVSGRRAILNDPDLHPEQQGLTYFRTLWSYLMKRCRCNDGRTKTLSTILAECARTECASSPQILRDDPTASAASYFHWFAVPAARMLFGDEGLTSVAGRQVVRQELLPCVRDLYSLLWDAGSRRLHELTIDMNDKKDQASTAHKGKTSPLLQTSPLLSRHRIGQNGEPS